MKQLEKYGFNPIFQLYKRAFIFRANKDIRILGEDIKWEK